MSIVSLPQHFNALRSRQDGPAAARRQQLEVVCEQFEALFLQQILKQMRKAGDVLAADDSMRSREMGTMREMHDEVLAQTLAGKRQTGIASMLVQQLGGGLDGAPTPAASLAGTPPALGQGGGLHALRGTWQRGVEALDSLWASGRAGFKSLVESVIRHESSGNVAAVSPKGARGLMQLMPGTAQDMAAELGLPYSEARLTEDADYNKRLGSAYLGKLLARYDGNQALAVAAYNAGPGKVDEWLKAHGDPRSGEIGMADWVEQIPYRETRDYTRKIIDDLQASAARASEPQASAPAVQPSHARWAENAQLSGNGSERLANGQLLAAAQGWRSGPAVRHAVEPGELKSTQAAVAFPDQRSVSHLSVAFAQPIRIERKTLS